MKNLLNCHCKGLHSFPISLENGLYRRIFYADADHDLWKPIELAIHPHHVDIKIHVLEGTLVNQTYLVTEYGKPFTKYQWDSHILNGNGGFKHLGEEKLLHIQDKAYNAGEGVTMQACELHTVFVEKGKIAVWIIEESVPTCESFPFNYSPYDLTKWTPEGLYIEVDDQVKEQYVGRFLQQLNQPQ